VPITAAVDRTYPQPAHARLRAWIVHRLQQQGGFTLIEVVVSAALLAVVTAGVYAGIDGPSRVSGNEKARSTAATIAQSDQERMRAMRFADLQNYAPSPAPKTVNSVNYTVTSRADWVEDSTATTGCSVPNGQGDYLQLTSTVGWAGGGSGNPVTVTSLLAPPVNDGTNGTGNIVVNLTDQGGGPVAGIPVSINGRSNLTRTTDSSGCAVFTNVLAGNYTATFSQAGYVDNLNSQPVSMQAGVASGQTVQLQHSYALASGVTVKFVASDGTTTVPWNRASVAGGALTAPTVITATPPTLPTTGKTLYPTSSGNYVAWAGGCADPGAAYDSVATVTPGSITTVPVIVPLMTLRVPTTGLPSAPRIVVKPSDPACNDTFTIPAATVSGGQYVWPIRLPRGKYNVCADLLSYRTTTPFTLPNQVAGGTDVQLSVTTDALGNVTGAKATPNDGSAQQSTAVAAGTCPS
jgi:prepilin-type N-terminal cleavage/methylation domain-containing protein